MNAKHGHTGAKWGKSRMSPTYMAWNNARSKYSKNILPANFVGKAGFLNFLTYVGPKPEGARLTQDPDGFWHWKPHGNSTPRKQSAATAEVSGPPVSTSGAGPVL